MCSSSAPPGSIGPGGVLPTTGGIDPMLRAPALGMNAVPGALRAAMNAQRGGLQSPVPSFGAPEQTQSMTTSMPAGQPLGNGTPAPSSIDPGYYGTSVGPGMGMGGMGGPMQPGGMVTNPGMNGSNPLQRNPGGLIPGFGSPQSVATMSPGMSPQALAVAQALARKPFTFGY